MTEAHREQEIVDSALTAEAQERWKAGAEAFKAFRKRITLLTRNGQEDQENALALLFLGERGLCFREFQEDFTNEDLTEYGLKRTKTYLYNPLKVQEIMKAHPEEFENGSAQIAESYMEYLEREGVEHKDTPRGLLLGYPYPEVKNYSLYVERRETNKEVQSRLNQLFRTENPDVRLTFSDADSIKIYVDFLREKLRTVSDIGLENRDASVFLQDNIDGFNLGTSEGIPGVPWRIFGEESEESTLAKKRMKMALAFLRSL